MEKWEYAVETWTLGITSADCEELEEKLNKFGNEGWELVNIIPQVGGFGGEVSVNFNQIVFKRRA
ncbi:MAG: DUF4177 domain-containing protein [Bacillota bacterium]|uniref:DUF4177 domain-containing protein n=1 Tax=Virgibacillus salarius TaxID=447199 RepID=A0A941IBW3_9BACI|nr:MULTISPECIES: DUF4177 domain-containing protein [Bacillaceae]NAZ10921.1 DUF4177 domain-containing protein [Agaribacter marinus]MBR7798213.1 DUF4177 domain-containing protein [Virgibacillus salarius]MCC2251469.1 DUF4177 domain-containing protein [Virgibacillus sp. AGTR]MDY7045821.1 DUF4177 domain-containing protein [Virgibacillus sp. M23]QRZ19867.1 DUF4177 domain-containing protein [Virgibacillus sp. AGTR]